MSVHDVEQFMLSEDNAGKLPAYAWPGGYAMFYLTEGGCILCAECATKEILSWQQNESDDPPAAYGAYGATDDYPSEIERCDDCGKAI